MDSDEEQIVAAASCVILSSALLLKELKKKGTYNASSMLQDLSQEPSGRFENFCRTSAVDFEYLLNRIGPHIKKETQCSGSLFMWQPCVA
nr:unnamed protein product [Callosobruchus analis]